LILAVIGVALAAAWWLTRNAPRRGGAAAPARPYLLGLVGVAVLLGLVWIVDHFADTDSKQIERALHTMATGVQSRDVGQVFGEISPSFHWLSFNKASFQRFAEGYIRNGGVSQVSIWDVEMREVSRERRTASVIFHFKVRGNAVDHPEVPYGCLSTFALDDDNHWRLQTMKLVGPGVDPVRGEPLTLPFS
jgi:hypothetical protein